MMRFPRHSWLGLAIAFSAGPGDMRSVFVSTPFGRLDRYVISAAESPPPQIAGAWVIFCQPEEHRIPVDCGRGSPIDCLKVARAWG